MNRAWELATLVNRRKFLAWTAALGIAGAAGCKNTPTTNQLQTRSQMGEDAADAASIPTIGSKTMIGNTDPLEVSGVGLVYQLSGTGSSPPQGGWRTMLEDTLKKQKRDLPVTTKELLDNPSRSTSLVIVSARIPPGARMDELIDIQITLPDESKTTSLQGGVLYPVELMTSDTTGNVHAQLHGSPSGGSGRLLLGSVWAKAQGPLIAGNFVSANGKGGGEDKDAEGRTSYRAGIIPGGGLVLANRPYYLILNPNEQNSRIAATIAERINTTFHSSFDPNLKIADAKNKELILLNVPPMYRHNHYRFLLVTRQVPYMPVSPNSEYRVRLEDELMDPATALIAAVKLEALGGDSRRSLRVGLESHSPWVRFAAAEALAYLGQTDGAAELARLAEDHPALRAQCLKAMASLDDAASTDRLVEMLSNTDDELRQGAFIALRLADKRHPALNGTLMNRSYHLHRMAPDAPSVVHLSTFGRSEILIFGDGMKLRGPVPPMAIGDDFTISWSADEQQAKVTRVVKGRDDAEVKEIRCAPTLVGILNAMAALGGGYSEAIALVAKADRAEILCGKVVTDAIPRELSIQQLAAFAKNDATLAKANLEVARVGTVRPELDAYGLELPNVQDEQIAPAGAPLVRPPLNRDPGRLFGHKRTPDAPILDPAVVPAGGQ